MYYLSNYVAKQITCLLQEDANHLKHSGSYVYRF